MPCSFGSLTESLSMHDWQPEYRTRNIHLTLPVTKQIQVNWTSDWHYDILVALCLLCKDNLTQVCALGDGTFCETMGNLCSKTRITLRNGTFNPNKKEAHSSDGHMGRTPSFGYDQILWVWNFRGVKGSIHLEIKADLWVWWIALVQLRYTCTSVSG